MIHDEKCEMSQMNRCFCAGRIFIQDKGWRDCLGHDPRISDSEWEMEVRDILTPAALTLLKRGPGGNWPPEAYEILTPAVMQAAEQRHIQC